MLPDTEWHVSVILPSFLPHPSLHILPSLLRSTYHAPLPYCVTILFPLICYRMMPSATACDAEDALIESAEECAQAATLLGITWYNPDGTTESGAMYNHVEGNTYTAGCYTNNYNSGVLLHFNSWGTQGQCNPSVWPDGRRQECFQICKITGIAYACCAVCFLHFRADRLMHFLTLSRCVPTSLAFLTLSPFFKAT